jgi:uncharacterized membrane protein YjgN (DUF898 family)
MNDLDTPMMQAAPAGSAAAAPAPPAGPSIQPRRLPLAFSATGGEYFRIWVVNLLFTIVTLGIYSAWAKVRKTRYFWSNTRLDGAAFQYHGRPAAILRGRILVGVLFVAYSLAGRISIEGGAAAAVAMGLLAPWLFYKAMRFKLSNTTWRGVRFGFDSTVGAAYATFAPAVILWALLSVELTTLRPGDRPGLRFFVAYGAFAALLPLLHARIKRYQHRATTWGAQRFDFRPSTGAFYALYGKSLLVALAAAVPFGAAMALTIGSIVSRKGPDLGSQQSTVVAIAAATYAIFLLAYVFPISFFSARLQRLVWARTHGGPFRFSTTVSAWGLTRTWLKNGLLTLLTLGLYWPYAAVAIARYRLECTSVEADAPLSSVSAGSPALEASAAGDGAVDFFGWDLGL